MLLVKGTLANGDTLQTDITDGFAEDLISCAPTKDGLGLQMMVMKQRPPTDAELLLLNRLEKSGRVEDKK